ncbi:MAG: hypothetical protein ACKVOK_05310 [Flavobacteriales bacterium]
MRIFSSLVYLWLFLNAVSLWGYSDILWTKSKILYRHGVSGSFLENFFYQLVWHPQRFNCIFSIHLIAALLGILDKRWSFIPRIAAWATGLIIFYSAVGVFNSGLLLMILMALFCSMVYTKAVSHYGIALSNAARIACLIQLAIVYFTAGVYKASGTQWLDGSALYYTAHIEHFSSPWMREFFTYHFFLSKLLTWFSLAYQLLFPLFLFIKKGRWIFLTLGIAFHLFIGIFMHLWDFATAMIVCYVLLIDDSFWKTTLFSKNRFLRKMAGNKEVRIQ